MIKVYPIKVEAIDEETKDLVFKMETFDQCAAILEMKATIGPSNIEDIVIALRQAVTMLELE